MKPERVLTHVSTMTFPRRHQGALVNEAGTVKWRCEHLHRFYDAALDCAEKARRRFVREGRAVA